MAIEKLDTRVGEVFIIRPDDDNENIYARAKVGEIVDLKDPAHYLRDIFAANRFGLGTRGAVLSMGEDDEGSIYLTYRMPADLANDIERLDEALKPFATTLLHWREMLELEAKE